jgi:nitrite reductase/ring-hydroxylating ferredoxin subunit
MLSRRQFLAASAVALAGRASAAELPPVRPVTRGPGFHWFGYYDKLQFDPTSRHCLGMRVEFEHRSPTPNDPITVGVIDLKNADKWTPLGRSTAWNWQQGCMLQWLPGSASKVLWNDRADGKFVCRILDVTTNAERVVPHPVYAVSPDGRSAVAPDFRRLADTRPGYGYAGVPDPFAEANAPDDAGITRIDLAAGTAKLVLSFAAVAGLTPRPTMAAAKHWFNHCLFNPSGSRFVFLHRWRVGKSWNTRMLTADPDGRNVRVLDANGTTSHFIWRDDGHILAWSNHPPHGKRFYLFADDGKTPPQVVGKDAMTEDGHCTYLPHTNNDWIVCDTYPDKDRRQHPYLFQVSSGKKVPLGHFESPKGYAGEWRCDTHPRVSPDGKSVVIDSPHAGGRQMYLIDVRPVVG